MQQREPALTAEEWAEELNYWEEPGNPRRMHGEFEGSDPKWEHHLAAIALYGQSFGFTHDHVRALYSVLYYGGSHTLCPVCDGAEWKLSAPPICGRCGFMPFTKGEYRALVTHAAQNIALLLPPSGDIQHRFIGKLTGLKP